MNNYENLSQLINKEFSKYSRIGILGYGKEGRSSIKLLSKYLTNTEFIISDINPTLEIEQEILELHNIKILKGEKWQEIFKFSDIVFVSPGVPLFNVYLPSNVVITSQIDFLFKHFSEKIIAVTGTKGKSTTTTLIHEILKTKFKNVLIAGNIGIPAFEILEEIDIADFCVLEVSSHQLQFVTSSPKYAVFLNIFPEHLDYYPDFDKYFQSKLNIFKFQNTSQYSILNFNNQIILEKLTKTNVNSQHIFYSNCNCKISCTYIANEKIYFKGKDSKECEIIDIVDIGLKGQHNLLNVLAAISVAKLLEIDNDRIKNVLVNFRGLAHRLEVINSKLGKVFINDSISTIPEASIAAIEAFKPVQTLILGGFDRGLFYDNFINNILETEIENIIFYGPAGKRMHEICLSFDLRNKKIIHFSNFDESVNYAILHTSENNKCLLSPAASSYDQFKNFEHRGFRFVELVRNFNNTD